MLNHCRSVPPATASRTFGSVRILLDGSFGFWISSDLQPAAASAASAPSPRASFQIFIMRILLELGESVVEFQHAGERPVRRIGEVVHAVGEWIAATRARHVWIVAAVLGVRPQVATDEAQSGAVEATRCARHPMLRNRPVHGELTQPQIGTLLHEVFV